MHRLSPYIFVKRDDGRGNLVFWWGCLWIRTNTKIWRRARARIGVAARRSESGAAPSNGEEHIWIRRRSLARRFLRLQISRWEGGRQRRFPSLQMHAPPLQPRRLVPIFPWPIERWLFVFFCLSSPIRCLCPLFPRYWDLDCCLCFRIKNQKKFADVWLFSFRLFCLPFLAFQSWW